MANFLLIRELCELKKITIRELASRIGKEDSSIQAIVRNGSTNTKTIEAIA
ncbi:helix-turn-helix domain-containing protein, partial [Bacteroides fragilis]